MQNLKKVQQNFVTEMQKHENIQNDFEMKINTCHSKVERLNRKIEKLKKEKYKTDYPHWTELLVRPVLSELKIAFPELVWDDERLSTFGLGCECPVFANFKDDTEDKSRAYIVFLPGDLNEGELLYQTGEKKNDYPKGTIGEINGFNKITKPIESMEELKTFVEKQLLNLNK